MICRCKRYIAEQEEVVLLQFSGFELLRSGSDSVVPDGRDTVYRVIDPNCAEYVIREEASGSEPGTCPILSLPSEHCKVNIPVKRNVAEAPVDVV
jgi:hypothetical protein